MPKLHCTHRAEWQLTPGKPAKRLSPHYQLGCDYGTPVIAIFKESDGVEPIYLCDNHAAEVGRASTNRTSGRPSEAQASTAKKQTTAGDQVRPAEVENAKPNGSAQPEITASRTAGEPERAATDPVLRAPVRNVASGNSYGNSAKALVDETIWNLETGDNDVYKTALQQGKSRIEAAQAAGGQLSIVQRKIGEYTVKLETLLSESKSRISAVEVINQPLEQAMLDIIGASTMDDAEKDAAIEQLGVLQEQLNRGLEREITIAQAQKIACAVGERANWGVSADLPEGLKPACWAVYKSVRDAIVAAVPEALNLLERLVNLCVASAELESAPQAKLPHRADTTEFQSLHP